MLLPIARPGLSESAAACQGAGLTKLKFFAVGA
jgi:hypothetical protein